MVHGMLHGKVKGDQGPRTTHAGTGQVYKETVNTLYCYKLVAGLSGKLRYQWIGVQSFLTDYDFTIMMTNDEAADWIFKTFN